MGGFIRLTEAQYSAMECAGVFEGVDEPLARFISGHEIQVTEESQTLVCELSNHLDDLGNGRIETDQEKRKWYRNDARVLSNLFSKMLRKAA